jgi:hypothetical protein
MDKKLEQDLATIKENYEKQIELAQAQYLKRISLDPQDTDLAEFLHKGICHHNHTDGCGWHYDNGDWTSYARKHYLEKARKVNKMIKKYNMRPDQIKDLLTEVFK